MNNGLIKNVCEMYQQKRSLAFIARTYGISIIKVRKILITEGLWSSERSDKINRLLKEGMSVKEIASKLYITECLVQAYMPYERGFYGEEKSMDAKRSDSYRKRQESFASKLQKQDDPFQEALKRSLIGEQHEL